MRGGQCCDGTLRSFVRLVVAVCMGITMGWNFGESADEIYWTVLVWEPARMVWR